jgi:mannose-6-phosphate isomerase
MAELWMGAHPKAPSEVEIGGNRTSLAELIVREPEKTLGAKVTNSFGTRLPFLFKVLCAAEPLSIQAHPSLEQAKAGFAREEQAGKPQSAADRNYRDDNHKPELICAVLPFWALRGFRNISEIADEFTTVELRSVDVPIEPPASESELSLFVARLLRLPEDERRDLVAGALALARERWGAYDPATPPNLDDGAARYYWVQRIADVHPGDIGILGPLFLNTVGLEPGQALIQPAGVLHAYLSGVGIELMANSDNVLRGGMTVKHIDVDELLSVGVFRSQRPELVEPAHSSLVESGSVEAWSFPTPFAEFELHAITVDGRVGVRTGSPMVVLAQDGRVAASDESTAVSLSAGRSCFVGAESKSLTLTGDGSVWIATVPV